MATEAQRRATRKYDAKTYKSLACKCKLPDYEKFQAYADNQNISSMNALLYKCVMYCIENNIDLQANNDII